MFYASGCVYKERESYNDQIILTHQSAKREKVFCKFHCILGFVLDSSENAFLSVCSESI
jgi:hypothetical protein